MRMMARRNGFRSKAGLSAGVLGVIGLAAVVGCSGGTDVEHTRTLRTREATADGGVVAPRELFLSAYDQCKQELTKNATIGPLTLPAGATEDDPLYVSLIGNAGQLVHVNFGSIALLTSPQTTLGTDIEQVNLTFQAARTLFGPLFDLCVAEKLRSVAPGMMGAEATLYSDSEQRELLYYTFNRAQRAAVGFARLGMVLTADPPVLWQPGDEEDPDGYQPLITWGRANPNQLIPLGEAFASAVNLHTTVSMEMAEMLARSASARYPRGGSATDLIDEQFGAGSWRMRATAFVYGGTALADDGAPWTEVEGIHSPGGYGWPPRLDAPRPMYDVPEPEAHVFGKLVSAISVATADNVTSPGAIPIFTKQSSDLTGVCVDLDINRIGSAVFDSVECLTKGNTASCASLPSDPAEYELWKKYRLRKEHAIAWAKHLADRMGPVCISFESGGIQKIVEGTKVLDPHGPAVIRGKLITAPTTQARLLGTETATPDGYLSVTSSFQDIPLEMRVGAFAALRPWPRPTGVFPAHYESGHIGSSRYGNIAHMGAANAMVAVREMLHDFEVRASGDLAEVFQTLGSKASRIHGLIDAQIGKASLDGFEVWDPHWNTLRTTLLVRADSSDAFWTQSGSQYELCATYDHRVVQMAVAQDSVFQSSTLANASCDVHVPLSSVAASSSEAGVVRYNGQVEGNRLPGNLIAVRTDQGGKKAYKLMVAGLGGAGYDESYTSTGGQLGHLVSRLWETQKQNPAKPKYDGFGYPTDFVPPADATLVGGANGQSALQVYLANAKEAASNATTAVQSALDALLEQQVDKAAATAADTRATEVNKLEEQGLCGAAAQTGVAVAGATVTCRDAVALQLEPVLDIDTLDAESRDSWSKGFGLGSAIPTDCLAQALEGFAVPGVENVAPSLEGWDAAQLEVGNAALGLSDLPGLLNDTGVQFVREFAAGMGGGELGPAITAEDKAAVIYLYCKALHNVNIVAGKYLPAASTGSKAQVARIVAMRRRESVVPSFSEFAGGELQSALIGQWTALRKLEEEAATYLASAEAAGFKVLAAKAAANAAVNEYKQSCNPTQFALATAACFKPSAILPSVEFDPNPLLNYQSNCRRLANEAGPVVAAADSAVVDANAQVVAGATRFTDASAAVHLASAQIAQLVQKADSAAKRNLLERDLDKQKLATQFGLYGRYHSYDLWRAKAMVESARRQAVIARRAIESRFVVDLSTMQSDEPFVAAPARWADEVYAYDMSLPAAVGLTVGKPTAGGIYVNKLTDYVGNLERFVQGFVVARPTASSKEDSEVLSIRGPYEKTTSIEGSVEHISPSPQAGKWEVFCPDTASWEKVYLKGLVTQHFVPDAEPPHDLVDVREVNYEWPDNPCPVTEAGQAASRPARARVVFSLDAWGRIDSTEVEEPYFRRYNARWTRLAVNLVGSGIQKCDAAVDPMACYTSPFIRYNLSHVGPAWVTNYEQQWRELSIPVGQVEAGKALAAEYWIDPLTAWGKPMVEPAARAEFTDRPLGGEYLLELKLGPEVDLRQLERVQILAGMTYWVKQD